MGQAGCLYSGSRSRRSLAPFNWTAAGNRCSASTKGPVAAQCTVSGWEVLLLYHVAAFACVIGCADSSCSGCSSSKGTA